MERIEKAAQRAAEVQRTLRLLRWQKPLNRNVLWKFLMKVLWIWWK